MPVEEALHVSAGISCQHLTKRYSYEQCSSRWHRTRPTIVTTRTAQTSDRMLDSGLRILPNGVEGFEILCFMILQCRWMSGAGRVAVAEVTVCTGSSVSSLSLVSLGKKHDSMFAWYLVFKAELLYRASVHTSTSPKDMWLSKEPVH